MSEKRAVISGSKRQPSKHAVVRDNRIDDNKLILVHLLVRPRPSTTKSLAECAAEISKTRNFMDHQTYLNAYGADADDMAKVKQFAQSYGLMVNDIDFMRRTVSLSGRTADMNRAFGVSLDIHDDAQHVFHSYTGQISVPYNLKDIIVWVWGLHTKPLGSQQYAGCFDNEPASYTPPQMAEFYDFPALDGDGTCVGVLEIYGGYKQSDMEIYFDKLGIPMPDIVDVGPNKWGVGEAYWGNFEVTMDVQIVASVLPKAKTAVYFSGATNDIDTTAWTYFKLISMGLFDQVNQPTVLTMSWGLPENLPNVWTKPEAIILNELIMVGAILGITICLPSGDSGSIFPYGNQMFNAPSLAYFPASSPWALSCGGTTIRTEQGKITKEIVWNRLGQHMNLTYVETAEETAVSTGFPYNLGATGGGVSMYFDLPDYQKNADVPLYEVINYSNFVFSDPQCFAGRGVPDVAAAADFLTGYQFCADGVWRSGGGTSAATPLWAALLTSIVQGLGGCRLGFINPLLYELQIDKNTHIFNDIVEGNNGGFAAHPDKKWNPCTGLGTPRGNALLQALRKKLG